MLRPIRVVMFGSGPELNPDAKEFLCRLAVHPEIELVGAFCQAGSRSLGAIFMDLWKRRGWLAFPLFMSWLSKKLLMYSLHPRREMSQKRKLKEISQRIHFVPDIHAREVLDTVQALEPDLGLIYGSPILKPELFEIPFLGTLGIHHGKLPEYRGNKTTFWAIYNGERCVSVTIQKVNKGLDTGSIVKTGEISIDRRSYAAIFNQLEGLGIEIYVQAILEVKRGVAFMNPQEGTKGKLYRNPKIGDFLRFWKRQLPRQLGFGRRS